MTYVVHYVVGSILFLGITTFFYLRQRRIPNRQDRLYSIMLLACLCALLFDFLAVAGNVPENWPVWVLYAFNMLFILSMQFCLPAFFFYVLLMTGHFGLLSKTKRGLATVPFALVVILTLLSPAGQFGIFYIDSHHIYHGGLTHAVLYFVAAFYIVFSGSYIFRCRQMIPEKKRKVIFASLTLVIIMMGLQMTFPSYLLATSATALGLTSMYYILQSPGDHTVPLTGLFNRTALPILLRDLMDQNRPFTLLLFSLRSFSLINSAFGSKTGDQLQLAFAEYLQNAFPGRYLIHVSSTSFGVIDTGTAMEREQLEHLPGAIPRYWRVANTDVQIFAGVAAIFSEDYKDVTQLLTTMDYMLQSSRQSDSDKILLADKAFRRECDYRVRVEGVMERILENNGMEVRFQPVFHRDGRPILLEAIAGVDDPVLGDVPAEWFLRVAEQTGKISQFNRQLLERVCHLIKEGLPETTGVECICVRLSVALCMRENAAEELFSVVSDCGVDAGQICFEVSESEAVSSLAVVRQNIKRLWDLGFSFLLDDFGTGYTDISLISALPFLCVKIDGSLLAEAMKSKRQEALLAGIGDVLKRLELPAVCREVETREQAALLDRLDIPLRQGSYYAPPLSAEGLRGLL